MIEYMKTWMELKADRRAVTALEYGLIAAAIVVVLGTAFGHLTGGLSDIFSNIGTKLTNTTVN